MGRVGLKLHNLRSFLPQHLVLSLAAYFYAKGITLTVHSLLVLAHFQLIIIPGIPTTNNRRQYNPDKG